MTNSESIEKDLLRLRLLAQLIEELIKTDSQSTFVSIKKEKQLLNEP